MSRLSKRLFGVLSVLLCSFILAISLPAQLLASEFPFAGSGTVNDPFLIASRQDLYDMAGLVNDSIFLVEGDVDYKSMHYKLSQDIDLNDEIDLKIVDNSTRNFPIIESFSGIFDGDGYAVKNLTANYIDIASAEIEPLVTFGISLFSTLEEGGVIKNIVLDNVSVDASAYEVSPLAGHVENGASVQNISVYGSISARRAAAVAIMNQGSG